MTREDASGALADKSRRRAQSRRAARTLPSHADTLALLARVEQAAPDGRRYAYCFAEALADALRTDFDALV
jgi:hypothetical protein